MLDAEARFLLDLMEQAVKNGRPQLTSLPHAVGRVAHVVVRHLEDEVDDVLHEASESHLRRNAVVGDDIEAGREVADRGVEIEVTEIQPTSKDPLRALVRTTNLVKNQKGETVLVYTPLRMMQGH